MRKHFPVALALLAISLLLLGCTGVPNPGAPADSSEKQIMFSWLTDNWAATSLLIVLITFFILGILYMFSQSFSNRELHAWVVTEFFQNIMSIVIIVVLVVLFVSVSQISAALVNLSDPASPIPPCGISECHFEFARAYLTGTIDPLTGVVDPDHPGLIKIAMDLADYSTNLAIRKMALSTYKISLVAVDLLPFLFSGYSMRPFAGVSIFADRGMLIADYALRLAASLNAQQLFLQYVQTALVPLLLVAGVALRAIFFTRKLGGLMIAIAIALFTVYPLTYFVFAYTFPVVIAVESTDMSGTDPLTGCVLEELYVDYPELTTAMCTAACDNNPNNYPPNPLDPSKNAPSFAKTACKDVCTSYCKDQSGVLDPVCYERCATGSPDYIFLCSILDDDGDGVYECDDAAEAAGGGANANDYRNEAKKFMQTNYPGIVTCNDLMVEQADPYAAVGVCSITNAAGAPVTCPSRALADCRVTYRDLHKLATPPPIYQITPDATYSYVSGPYPGGISPPQLAYKFPDYYDEVLPQLPNECKASQDIVDACQQCAANAISGVTTPAEAARLTILPDPEMQTDCTKSDILESGTIPPLDDRKFTVKGDIEAAAKLLIAGVILPIFNFIITITFVKVLSPLLGGDVDIAGIMRMM